LRARLSLACVIYILTGILNHTLISPSQLN
jgi:hypothetical protein